MSIDDKLAAKRFEVDMKRLCEGRQPLPSVLADAPLLRWWRPMRFPEPALSDVDGPVAFCISGTTGRRRPGPDAILKATGPLMWMDREFRWCRDRDRFWRLGERDDGPPDAT